MRYLPDERLYFDIRYCLDFAKSITSVPSFLPEPVIFHFYWRGQCNRKVAFAINSFRVTQDPTRTALWLWIDVASRDFEIRCAATRNCSALLSR